MEIFNASKRFPRRRSIHSWTKSGAHLDLLYKSARGLGKRRYQAHFVSKLTDTDGENAEGETRLDFACDCGCLLKPEHAKLVEKCHEVGAMLGSMTQNPSSFILKSLSTSG